MLKAASLNEKYVEKNDKKEKEETFESEFNKQLNDFWVKFGEQIEKFTSTLAYTDRKIIGALLGMLIFAIIAYFAIGKTAPWVVGGGNILINY